MTEESGTGVLAPAIAAALSGDRSAIRALVDRVTPVIQARVVRGLLRRRDARDGRDIRQEVEDMTQDVFGALFAHDGRALRSFDPARGLSLENYVGLIAERQVSSILRSGRRNPWRDVPEDLDERADLEAAAATPAGPELDTILDSRRALEQLLDRMREVLSPRGLELFQRLYVDEEPIEGVAETMGMTRDAIYAWRNRMGKLLQRLALELAREAPPKGAAGGQPDTPEDAR
jgi:RNA polymerase sigma factor (sigma-70 family)